ncbi:uncharacterized protein [Antedon mediterranea]
MQYMLCTVYCTYIIQVQELNSRHRQSVKQHRRRNQAVKFTRRRRVRHQQRAMAYRLYAMAAIDGTSCIRRIWVKDRRHGLVFWNTVMTTYTDEDWRRHFRMCKATFEFIANELRPALEKETTNWRAPIPYKVRLAAVIWWLATPTEYRSISNMFGIGISTLCNLAREVCFAIRRNLFKRYISLPSGERLTATINGFERRRFPQCAGAIDGTHVPILAPSKNPADYHNRKGWHSVIMQAVVDHNFCFTDVNIGWPGRTHDARVLANSNIFSLAEDRQNGHLFPMENSTVINGVEVPVFLIGDAAYPLKKWLMKPYTNHALTADQRRFNTRLSSARMVVENAFGRLKGRWRILLKRNDVNISFVSDVVASCSVLHNICEMHKEQFYPEWDEEMRNYERQHGLVQPNDNVDPNNQNIDVTSDIRDAVSAFL